MPRQPAQRRVPVDGGEPAEPVGPRGVQAEQGVGQGPFGVIEGRQVDGGDLRGGLGRPGPGRRGYLLADHAVGGGQFVQAGAGQLGRHVEDLGGVGDQVRGGQVAVAVVGGLGQGVGQAGLDPLRAAGGNAGRLGDRAGKLVNRYTALRSLTLLRQLCLDAGLIDVYADLPSAKADLLVERLRELINGGHRALVFSQFTRFLGKIRTRLAAEGLTCCYLDGQTAMGAGHAR